MDRSRICAEIGGCRWQQRVYVALIRYCVPTVLLVTLLASLLRVGG